MNAKDKNPDVFSAGTSILEDDPRWKIAERVARSSALYRATQLREMLLFIVRQLILNPDEPIHESEIAHRVLGRRSDFNPLDDNIVRVQMAHLRKKLDLYFTTDGRHEDVVITIALGSYKPLFSPRSHIAAPGPLETDKEREDQTSAESAAGDTLPSHAGASQMILPESGRRRGIALQLASFGLLALAVCCIAMLFHIHNLQQSLNVAHQSLSPWKTQAAAEMWTGFFDRNHDTDVVISDDSFLLIEELSKEQTPFYGYLGRSYLDPSQNKNLSAEERFVEELVASKSLGNTSEFKLAQRILALDPLNKRMHLYSARQYMPALVKQDNVILIGGRISNPWSELFENRLNFIEDTRFEGLGITVVKNRAPAAGEAPSYTSTDSVGYCVVAYLPNPDQTGKALLLEGTSSEATEAAGDFLSGEQFSAFRQKLHSTTLPYFEVLLKTSQVRGTPLTVTIEAYRVYTDMH